MKRSRWIALTVAAFAVALVTAGSAAGASRHHPGDAYTVTPLVSDQAGMAPTVDPNLVNAWGISAGPMTPWWVANNGTETSTLYDAAGTRFPPPPDGPLVVSVPGAPTGTVYYGGTKLLVSNGTTMVPAKFIFATEAGTIEGWPPGSPATVTGADGSEVGSRLQGPRDRGRLALRDRLPQRPRGHLRRRLEAREAARRVQRPVAARRATPRSGSRTSAGTSS